MNLFQLFNALGAHDEAIYDRISSRRASIQRLGSLGRKAGATGLGLFLGSVLQKAYAGQRDTGPEMVKATVAFALQLERAELGLYQQAATLNVIRDNRDAFNLILENETRHVATLEATATTLGLRPNDPTQFPIQVADLTGSGMVPTALTTELDAIMVLQASEETGGRAYRGNAYTLLSNPDVLQAALRFHSVESRHAAHWRGVRQQHYWILRGDTTNTGNVGPVPAMVYAKTGTTTNGIDYPNEANTTQADLMGTSYTSVGDDRLAEAFDEGLDPAAVTALVQPFGFRPPNL